MSLRPVAPLVLSFVAGLVVFGSAHAQERTDYRDVYNNVLGTIGLGKDRDPIDYTPRPPIVVPPTNTLPPPVEPGQMRATGFPDDPDVAARRKALVDPRQPAPQTGPGTSRAYLIEPPAAYFNAAAVAATGRDADKGDAEPVKKRSHRHRGDAAPQ